MSTTTFEFGETGSASKMSQALANLQTQGQKVLDQLVSVRLNSLVEFDRRLSAINARRQRINRVLSPQIAVRFAVSDFVDIDQVETTATVRADSSSVSLRERARPIAAVIRFLRFSSDVGSVQALDQTQSLFRVATDNQQTPVGQFNIELLVPLDVSLLVFDIAAMPSTPGIRVEVSASGLSYVPARQVELNGYRVVAWFAPSSVRFVRVTLSPTHPDELGGSAYTFGLTDFTATAVEFHLLSELVTRDVAFIPLSQNLRLNAPSDPGLQYFVALDDPTATAGVLTEVAPGGTLAIPGVEATSIQGIGYAGTTFVPGQNQSEGDLIRPTVPNGFLYLVTSPGTTDIIEPTWPTIEGSTVISGAVSFLTQRDGQLSYVLPDNIYLTSVVVTQDSDGTSLPVAPGLDPFDLRAPQLLGTYVSVVGPTLYIVSADVLGDINNTFSFSFLSGPLLMQARMKVQLATSDSSVTPIFTGATLEQV